MNISCGAESGSTIVFCKDECNFTWGRSIDDTAFVNHPIIGGSVATEVSGIGENTRGIIEGVLQASKICYGLEHTRGKWHIPRHSDKRARAYTRSGYWMLAGYTLPDKTNGCQYKGKTPLLGRNLRYRNRRSRIHLEEADQHFKSFDETRVKPKGKVIWDTYHVQRGNPLQIIREAEP